MVTVLLAAAIECSALEVERLQKAGDLVRQGSDAVAIAELTAAGTCDRLMIASRSLIAWHQARAAAAKGGAAELIAPIRKTLESMMPSRPAEYAIDGEYAVTLVRAAIAAAQDERAEMELLLTHARDLSERLARRGRLASWPRPFNLAAGELWLEVDRYDDARAAFQRAAQSPGDAAAFAGLARAFHRLGDHPAACRAYGNVRDASPELTAEAQAFLSRCR